MADQHFTKGTRVSYQWVKPFAGETPGTIKDISRGLVSVHWDDGTKTISSKKWIQKWCKIL